MITDRFDSMGRKIRSPKAIKARTAPEPEPITGARWIPLNQGYFAIIDEEDFERFGNLVWTVKKTPRTEYAFYHRLIDGVLRRFYLHRLIMNAPDGMEVDHRNRNGLDCRKQNLRLCSHLENHRNMPKQNRPNSSSRFKGVTWYESRLIWRAQIKVNYKTKVLGQFTAEEDAAKAYDLAAREYFGEFASLNFPVPE